MGGRRRGVGTNHGPSYEQGRRMANGWEERGTRDCFAERAGGLAVSAGVRALELGERGAALHGAVRETWEGARGALLLEIGAGPER